MTHDTKSAVLAIEDAVLAALDHLTDMHGPLYFGLSQISDIARVPLEYTRIALRSLRDQGATNYGRGLFDKDGNPRGSGYAITDEGRSRASQDNGVMVVRLRLPRRWSIDRHSGELFDDDIEFDGYALTIEIWDEAEAHQLYSEMQKKRPQTREVKQ